MNSPPGKQEIGFFNLQKFCEKINAPTLETEWGTESTWAHEKGIFTAKILAIDAGAALPTRNHEAKTTTMLVMSGCADLRYGDIILRVYAGRTIHIPPKTTHALTAIEKTYVMQVETCEPKDEPISCRELIHGLPFPAENE